MLTPKNKLNHETIVKAAALMARKNAETACLDAGTYVFKHLGLEMREENNPFIPNISVKTNSIFEITVTISVSEARLAALLCDFHDPDGRNDSETGAMFDMLYAVQESTGSFGRFLGSEVVMSPLQSHPSQMATHYRIKFDDTLANPGLSPFLSECRLRLEQAAEHVSRRTSADYDAFMASH